MNRTWDVDDWMGECRKLEERAEKAEAERDVLRGEVVALRKALEKIALREPYQHCHDCNITHEEANRALRATPHAATLGALVEATVEEQRLRHRYDDERMSLVAGRELMAEIVAASLRRVAAADAVLTLRDSK